MKNETEFGIYFKMPNPNLRSYFGRVVAGQPDEYRTNWYGKDTPLSTILSKWIRILEPGIRNKWNSLWNFEMDLAKKVGPMSIMRPLAERMSDIDHYYEDILLPSKPISQKAIDAVIREWGPYRGIRVRSQPRTVAAMKKSTNSGSPYFSKRSLVEGKTTPCKVYPCGQEVIQELGNIGIGPDKRLNAPWLAAAVLGWRGQEGGPTDEDVKQRVVWMFPFAVNIEELQVYQPLIEAAQHGNLVPAWNGMDAVNAEMTRLFDTKDERDLIICTDFERFDQHFNESMQRCALQILQGVLTDEHASQDWLERVYPIKYMIPLAYNWGCIRHGKHGMGSGSGGTNADETLAHRALQYEAAYADGSFLNPHSMCLGDDGVLSYPGCTVESVTSSYSRHGLSMNLTKQYASTRDCTFLRRWFCKDYRMDGICVGVYSTCRAIGRLAEQERYYDPEVWSAEMVALRQLSIIENVKYHPLREEFARFCMKGDRYRLGIDIPGFLANIKQKAKEAIDYMPDFLGYTRSLGTSDQTVSDGIENWWIVQYLKSIA